MYDLLVPFDNSPSARRALDHALAMVRARAGTRLQVLSVLDDVGMDTRELVDAAEIDRVLAAEAAAILDPARALVEPTGIACTYHSAAGTPARTIAEHARAHGVGEIVMGTRGLGTLSGLLLGSVAQRVLLLADCPVTLVK
ncbi:MAG: universal stress protein [Burkholderiales bacterium]|nr:universal stress protein [Burkholderiales bacterium]